MTDPKEAAEREMLMAADDAIRAGGDLRDALRAAAAVRAKYLASVPRDMTVEQKRVLAKEAWYKTPRDFHAAYIANEVRLFADPEAAGPVSEGGA